MSAEVGILVGLLVLVVVAIVVYEMSLRRKPDADDPPGAARVPRWLRILADYTIGGMPGQKGPTK